MPREQNFLLGHGERLASTETIKKGGSKKKLPYSFSQAQQRTGAKLTRTVAQLQKLPQDACPSDEALAIVTLHPRFLSKSELPTDFLRNAGLRTVGSRSRKIQPEQWGVEKHSEEAVTAELFVAGKRAAFEAWRRDIANWTPASPGAETLSQLESIAAIPSIEKVKSVPTDVAKTMLEVVLHNARSNAIVDAFVHFAEARGAEPLMDRRRDVQGLTFLPVVAAPELAAELAEFAFVRVARGMPSLRPFRPSVLRGARGSKVSLPQEGPFDDVTRAVIFDGGLPALAQTFLAPWVRYIEPLGIGSPPAGYLEHGLNVTTAFLFGPLTDGKPAPRPICGVDHVRVLDDQTGSQLGSELELYDVLDRIAECVQDGQHQPRSKLGDGR
jgi:hypothetical protein